MSRSLPSRRLTPFVIVAAASLALVVAVPAAPASAGGGGPSQIVYHAGQGGDPVAVRVLGATTYVLDSGWAETYRRGSLLIEHGVTTTHAAIVRTRFPDGHGLPTALDVDPSTGYAYVTQDAADKLDVVSPAGKIVQQRSLKGLADHPDAVGVDTTANLLYVGDDDTGNVLVLDLGTLQLLRKIHPLHSWAGITSLAVDARHHEVWAASRGGLLFLLSLGNTGVTQIGSTYTDDRHGDKDTWNASVGLAYGMDGAGGPSVHAVTVHDRSLLTVTDVDAIGMFQNPHRNAGRGLTFAAGLIADQVSVDPSGPDAWVVFSSARKILQVDIRFVLGTAGRPASGRPGVIGGWSYATLTPTAVFSPFTGSGWVLVAGHDTPAHGAQSGFLQVMRPS